MTVLAQAAALGIGLDTVAATALFGSRARGDAVEGSDVDLLLWTSEAFPRHVKAGSMSLALYPEADLLDKARRGDLFAAHLAFEAVALHDPDGKLEELRRSYSPPASYLPQINAASDLAWCLVGHAARLQPALLNARAAWCARTIAIARCAEAGRIAFATEILAANLAAHELSDLVRLKDSEERVFDSTPQLRRFVSRHGRPNPLPSALRSLRGFRDHFERTANGFALKTIRQARLKDPQGSYI